MKQTLYIGRRSLAFVFADGCRVSLVLVQSTKLVQSSLVFENFRPDIREFLAAYHLSVVKHTKV